MPFRVWVAILVLAFLNNMIPFVLFGWGQQRIASGLAAILNIAGYASGDRGDIGIVHLEAD